MKSITSIGYPGLLWLFRVMPFKKSLCDLLKGLNLVGDQFYRDFSFRGEFKVDVNGKGDFLIHHYGGPIENETYWKGLFTTFENDTGWLWMELAPVSNAIFDIGANSGLYSLAAAALNPGAEIHAFEPSRNTFQKLEYNSQLNGFNITCWQIALSNKNGKQVFYDTPDKNQTSASLSPEKLKNFKNYDGEIVEYEVATKRLDGFIEEHSIKGIDLMKIDIEMHEPEAIEGFGEMLNQLKPVVFIEVLTHEVAERLNELIDGDFLKFRLEGKQKARQIEQFEVKPDQWNYVIFHHEKEDLMRSSTSLFN